MVEYLSGERIQGSSTAPNKTILIFNSSGSFTPTESFDVEYLVIGGGAGGGRNNGGGGGAGAYRTATGLGVTAQAYTVTVGAGGTGNTSNAIAQWRDGDSTTGGDSVFSTITSEGGGAGGGEWYPSGGNRDGYTNGNASAGGAGNNQNGGSSGAYGYDGGDSPNNHGGGGGGSSAVGADSYGGNSGGYGGAGGAGTSSSITGTAVIRAGGGGGASQAGTAGTGGSGGGGNGGGNNTVGSNATANTGSGGGGGQNANGGVGGSGVVILSFAGGKGYSATGSPTVVSTTTDEKSSITNIPVGTRYEETDTRKIFRMAADLISGTDLKAYWKFNESSGNIANVASTVEGNSTMNASDTALVATGSPTYSQSSSNPSNLGNSLLFDGSNDIVQASTGSNTLSQFNFLHDGTTPYTISFWAKFPSGADGTLFDNFRGFDDYKGMWITTSPQGHWRFEISRTTGNQHVIKTDGNPQLEIPTDNAWHFYCFRWNYSLGSDNLVYSVDNATSGQYFEEVDRDQSPSTGNSEHDLAIGGRSNETDYTNLYLAEFSIFHRILTAAEVTKLYNSGAGFQLDTGLKVWTEKGTA